MSFKDNINTWIFDLDNTLYSADSGIFQQVHKLMGEFVAKNLNMELAEAKKLQAKYYKQHGTTLRGMMDNHDVDPDYFFIGRNFWLWNIISHFNIIYFIKKIC